MKKFARIMSLALVIVSLLAMAIPAQAASGLFNNDNGGNRRFAFTTCPKGHFYLMNNFKINGTSGHVYYAELEYVGGVGHLGASGLDTCGGKTGQPRRGDWTLT